MSRRPSVCKDWMKVVHLANLTPRRGKKSVAHDDTKAATRLTSCPRSIRFAFLGGYGERSEQRSQGE